MDMNTLLAFTLILSTQQTQSVETKRIQAAYERLDYTNTQKQSHTITHEVRYEKA